MVAGGALFPLIDLYLQPLNAVMRRLVYYVRYMDAVN